jgi:hypothetical protein
MPRRVVFEGSKKSQELTLANTGVDTATFVVSFIQYRMKDDGSFEPVVTPDSGQFFSDKYFRIFPRTVTLAPKESQVVKIQLVKSAKMEPGEYRSHLYFRSEPKIGLPGETNAKNDTASMQVKLIPVFGITIPAIIRVGDLSVKVDIKNAGVVKINDTLNQVRMELYRTGNISVYGDMVVNYTSPQGQVTRVASVKGLAVYTPNKYRSFQCNLDRIPGVDYRSGKLTIVYSTPDDIKSSILAQADLVLH